MKAIIAIVLYIGTVMEPNETMTVYSFKDQASCEQWQAEYPEDAVIEVCAPYQYIPEAQ